MMSDLKSLESKINLLLHNQIMDTAKIELLESMVLSVYKETLPKKDWIGIHTNYYERLKEEMNKAFSLSEEMTGNPFLQERESFDFHLYVKTKLDELKELDNE